MVIDHSAVELQPPLARVVMLPDRKRAVGPQVALQAQPVLRRQEMVEVLLVERLRVRVQVAATIPQG